MIVLVTGIDDSGRDEIVDMVLQTHKAVMPPAVQVKLADSLPDVSNERSLSKLAAMRDNAASKLEKSVIGLLRKGGNIVVTGCATKATNHGYLPVLTEDFVDKLNQDLIIMMELMPQHVQSYMEHEHVDWLHQRVERHMTSIFSMRTGAPLKVIKVRSGRVKESMKEAFDSMRAAME